MIPEKKDLPGAKSGRSFFLFCIVLMPLSLSRGEEATRRHHYSRHNELCVYLFVEENYSNREYLFEIWGKGKNFEQIKDEPNSFLAVDDIEIGQFNRIPLWMFGFLY